METWSAFSFVNADIKFEITNHVAPDAFVRGVLLLLIADAHSRCRRMAAITRGFLRPCNTAITASGFSSGA